MIVKNHIDETNDLKLIADNKSRAHIDFERIYAQCARSSSIWHQSTRYRSLSSIKSSETY